MSFRFLSSLLIESSILPQEWDKIPYHPDFPDIQDWDRADTAIDWPYFRRELEFAKKEAKHLPELRSHDHLNVQVDVPIDDAVIEGWRAKFQELEDGEKAKGIELVFVLIDGFLLYYDPVSPL
jgi:nicotinamide/nicotinate riboside kinase